MLWPDMSRSSVVQDALMEWPHIRSNTQTVMGYRGYRQEPSIGRVKWNQDHAGGSPSCSRAAEACAWIPYLQKLQDGGYISIGVYRSANHRPVFLLTLLLSWTLRSPLRGRTSTSTALEAAGFRVQTARGYVSLTVLLGKHDSPLGSLANGCSAQSQPSPLLPRAKSRRLSHVLHNGVHSALPPTTKQLHRIAPADPSGGGCHSRVRSGLAEPLWPLPTTTLRWMSSFLWLWGFLVVVVSLVSSSNAACFCVIFGRVSSLATSQPSLNRPGYEAPPCVFLRHY